MLCLITGPSGSGKTRIASELQKCLSIGFSKKAIEVDEDDDNQISSPAKQRIQNSTSVVVIHQDDYFTKPFLPYKERVDDSYENASGINLDSLFADVQSVLEDSEDGNDEIARGDRIPTIVIVEGHLLGDAASLFRQKYFCEDIGILGVFLVGCSQESCKQRRLDRNKDRSEEERKELADYIDNFVWPSFLSYGVDAMDALRQALAGASSIKGNANDESFSEKIKNCPREMNKSISLDIDNSEGANLRENVDHIVDQISHILSV